MPFDEFVLFTQKEARRILERGLLHGRWSVTSFNRGNAQSPVLPSLGFLEQHPQFKDRHFRDLAAYQRCEQTNDTPPPSP